jgi:hypothetical protein
MLRVLQFVKYRGASVAMINHVVRLTALLSAWKFSAEGLLPQATVNALIEK